MTRRSQMEQINDTLRQIARIDIAEAHGEDCGHERPIVDTISNEYYYQCTLLQELDDLNVIKRLRDEISACEKEDEANRHYLADLKQQLRSLE